MVQYFTGALPNAKRTLVLEGKVRVGNGLENKKLWADRSMADRRLGNLNRNGEGFGFESRSVHALLRKL